MSRTLKHYKYMIFDTVFNRSTVDIFNRPIPLGITDDLVLAKKLRFLYVFSSAFKGKHADGKTPDITDELVSIASKEWEKRILDSIGYKDVSTMYRNETIDTIAATLFDSLHLMIEHSPFCFDEMGDGIQKIDKEQKYTVENNPPILASPIPNSKDKYPVVRSMDDFIDKCERVYNGLCDKYGKKERFTNIEYNNTTI